MTSLIWLMVVLVFPFLLPLISCMFYEGVKEIESDSSFECGIDPVSLIRTPLYTHFVFITIVFLVFDVELAITMPLVYSFIGDEYWNSYYYVVIFILFLGLILEVFKSSFEWKE